MYNSFDDAYEKARHHYGALKNVDMIFNVSSAKELAFLETFGIPYVGSGIDLVPLNKAIRKEIIAYRGSAEKEDFHS